MISKRQLQVDRPLCLLALKLESVPRFVRADNEVVPESRAILDAVTTVASNGWCQLVWTKLLRDGNFLKAVVRAQSNGSLFPSIGQLHFARQGPCIPPCLNPSLIGPIGKRLLHFDTVDSCNTCLEIQIHIRGKPGCRTINPERRSPIDGPYVVRGGIKTSLNHNVA